MIRWKSEYNKPLAIGVVLLVLVSTGVSLAGARGKISILEDQLEASQDSTKVAVDSLRVEQAESDALIAAQDENEERTDSIITEATEAVEVAVEGTDAAVAAARNAAADLPIVQEALDVVTQELEQEREVNAVFRATSAAEIFAGQQRERTLGMQLLSERSASAEVIAGLNVSLTLAIERGDIAVNALSPSFFTKIFDMPEVALFGAVVGATVALVVVR